MAGLTRRVRPWICCYSSHRNLSWHGSLAERKMQTLESLVCRLGWETRAGQVPRSWGRCQLGWRHAGAWAQVAPGCLGRTQLLQDPGPAIHPFLCSGTLVLPSIPSPSPSRAPISIGDANPNPWALGERGFAFRHGKLGGDFRLLSAGQQGLSTGL